MKTIIFATRNKGKLKEIKRLLKGMDVGVVPLDDLSQDIEIVEDGDTFSANAIKKASTVGQTTQRPALADDSGLEVDALDGRPGVHSARFGGPGLDDAGRNAHLLSELANVAPGDRRARFRCVLAYVAPGSPPRLFHGVLEGHIAAQPSGNGGFGYDPLFVPDGYDKTLGELGADIKNRISHRAKALAEFVEWMEDQQR